MTDALRQRAADRRLAGHLDAARAMVDAIDERRRQDKRSAYGCSDAGRGVVPEPEPGLANWPDDPSTWTD